MRPICFSVMGLLQGSLRIINRPAEPNASNCIISVGTDYKVTGNCSFILSGTVTNGSGPVDFLGVALYKCKLHIFCYSDCALMVTPAN